MKDVSVVDLLTEILDDEKKAQILELISKGSYGEDLLKQLLNICGGE